MFYYDIVYLLKRIVDRHSFALAAPSIGNYHNAFKIFAALCYLDPSGIWPGVKYLSNFWRRFNRHSGSIMMVQVDAVCFVYVGLQGMAFTLEERLQLGTHGLLPPCFISQDVQVMRVHKNYAMRKDDLDRWGLIENQTPLCVTSSGWAEAPVTAPLMLCVCTHARRAPTSGSLQNTRGRLVIIPPRATSISAHCIFLWAIPSPSSLCFAVSPPLSVSTVFTTSSVAEWKRRVCTLH